MDAEGGTVGPVDDAPWIEALTFHPISPFNIDWLINSFAVFFSKAISQHVMEMETHFGLEIDACLI